MLAEADERTERTLCSNFINCQFFLSVSDFKKTYDTMAPGTDHSYTNGVTNGASKMAKLALPQSHQDVSRGTYHSGYSDR